MYVVYILECNDKTLYTGITTDLKRRLEQHRQGEGARYTRARGVKRVLYTEKCKNQSEALSREYAIKQLTRLEKLALIKKHRKI